MIDWVSSDCLYDVIVLRETWLDSDISDAELVFNMFVIYRCDRSVLTSHKKICGGGIVAVRNKYCDEILVIAVV